MSAGRSWNWRLAPMSDDERAHYQRQGEKAEPQYKHFYLCRKKGCGALPSVYVRYDYVTGRAGRVSWQERPYCSAHGEQLVAAKRQAAAA